MEEFSEKELDLLRKLKSKYEGQGESFEDHLEGTLYSDFTNYWDYIGIDALLNLQKPKTQYPDEMIFIIYHQVSELFFKIIIHEIEKIGYASLEELNAEMFIKRVRRINNYYHHLVYSYDALVQGMEYKQFMSFRTALTPASGFQSIQYRLIELWSTDFRNILSTKYRDVFTDEAKIREMYPYLYWTAGATEVDTEKKTLTLRQFEKKYQKLIIRKGNEFKEINLMKKYLSLSKEDQQNPELIELLKMYDVNANINWPLTHYKQASKYLRKGSMTARSTGGTNWKEYLPPHFQKNIFFPMLWSDDEKESWGKQWVVNVLETNTK